MSSRRLFVPFLLLLGCSDFSEATPAGDRRLVYGAPADVAELETATPTPAVDGGRAAPAPSAGCKKGLRRGGGVINQGTSIYQFPDKYDGTEPLPLVVALHAAGNPNTQLRDLTSASDLARQYVMIFPKSAGSAWNYATDKSRVDADIERLKSDYCVDTNRIFGTGHSSGAQMLVQMLCNGERQLRGVAPVAASKYCNAVSTPVLYIQGKTDSQRGGRNGKDVVDMFASGNACSATVAPDATPRCLSTYNKASVTPGCVEYRGCKAPTLWCSHDDAAYGGTNHGWPCFATPRIHAFFESLR